MPSMPHIDIENVTFIRKLPSGKSFLVSYQGAEYVIPNFAVGANSAIWSDSEEGDTDTLFIQEVIAYEKGIVDLGIAPLSLGGGIPLKRNKLPDPPEMMHGLKLEAIESRLQLCSGEAPGGWVDKEGGQIWNGEGENVDLLAMFDGSTAMHDAFFCANAPADMRALLDEVKVLRAWVAKAQEKASARRKRK